MMGTNLHWVQGPWPGKLALAARPRGGDWLKDEITSWQRGGIDMVVSLLTGEEERELDIANEEAEVREQGMGFLSFPISDRQVPKSQRHLSQVVDTLDHELASGKSIVLHCRQGVGRAGLVAACLLLTGGIQPKAAISRLSAARGAPVPETAEQRRWIDQYAESFAATR